MLIMRKSMLSTATTPGAAALPGRMNEPIFFPMASLPDRKSTRLNSSHTVIYTLSLHDALPIYVDNAEVDALDSHNSRRSGSARTDERADILPDGLSARSEEHTSELQSHSDLHSFPTRRSSDLC